jgi:hypothetical protein
MADTFEDYTIETFPISLNYSWIREGQGEYNLTENGLTLIRFTDQLGMDIRVEGDMEADALAELIGALEYVGPDIESVGNPWGNACAR